MKAKEWADRAWPWLFAPFLVAECSCVPPRFTAAEVRCLASVEMREDAEIAACDGCDLDAVMDRYDAEAEGCIK